ncbi:MAG: NAD(P)H-dependent oxidoreductase subunit E [Bacteroidota bacterium]
MKNKSEIVICLGSSCFARGNKEVVHIIKLYLEDKNLTDKVFYHGAHCFGNCENGSCIKINGKQIESVNAENIIDYLNKELI